MAPGSLTRGVRGGYNCPRLPTSKEQRRSGEGRLSFCPFPTHVHEQPGQGGRVQRHPYEIERDACGIGFVADARGRPSRAIVEAALEALCRVRHRGAVAADALTGDGSGLLLPIPRRLLDPVGADAERLGIAMVFTDPGRVAEGRSIVEEACRSEDLEVARWRPVPTDEAALGAQARESM